MAPALLFGAQTPEVSHGKAYFEKKCRICHASDGTGTATMRKRYGDRLPSLASNEVQKKSPAALAESLKAATRHKTLVEQMKAADLKNVISYIQTLKPKP